MRIFGHGKCSPTRHLWNRDPNAIPNGTVFYRVDCARCDYKMDAVPAKAMFEKLGTKIPGRVKKAS